MTAEEFLTTNDLNPSRKTYTRGDVIAFAEEYYKHKREISQLEMKEYASQFRQDVSDEEVIIYSKK